MLDAPSHIWAVILPYCRNPRPQPLSRPLRCDLKQPHLAVLMRVSKLFNAISEPLLDKEIVIDELSLLLLDAKSRTKRRQYALTTSLYIEYRERQYDHTHKDILGDSRTWPLVGDQAKTKKKSYMLDCTDDVDHLIKGLEAVEKQGMRGVFPNLSTIAVASIYGRENDHWKRYEDLHARTYSIPNTIRCSQLWDSFLSSGSLRHLCVRDPSGPLNISKLSHVTDPAVPKFNHTLCLHFSADCDRLPLPLGRKIRYVCDAASSDNWSDILREMGEKLHQSARVRARELQWPDLADVQIYCSTTYASPASNPPDSCFMLQPQYCGRRLAVAEQQFVASELGAIIQDLYRQQSGKKDEIRWYASAETPRCEACGSAAPA